MDVRLRAHGGPRLAQRRSLQQRGAGGASSDSSGLDEPDSVAPAGVDEAEVTEPPPDVEIEEATARWTCVYAPTVDHDWHNDVLCSNGEQEERPATPPA